MMDVRYTEKANKQLLDMASDVTQRVKEKIALYAADPANLANQVKKLKGLDALRLRVGDYRVIFRNDGTVLTVMKVGHRRDIYD